MTWPTTPVSTANVDAGADNPALARIQIKQVMDNVNDIAAEFGNVSAGGSSADLHLLQYVGGTSTWTTGFPQLHRYSEKAYSHPTTTGNTTINFQAGNVQTIAATGNPSFLFSNFPQCGTVTVVYTHGATARTASWPASAKFAAGDSALSTVANLTDIIVITTVDGGVTYFVSIVRGFA